jgi:hypothetical protein
MGLNIVNGSEQTVERVIGKLPKKRNNTLVICYRGGQSGKGLDSSMIVEPGLQRWPGNFTRLTCCYNCSEAIRSVVSLSRKGTPKFLKKLYANKVRVVKWNKRQRLEKGLADEGGTLLCSFLDPNT